MKLGLSGKALTNYFKGLMASLLIIGSGIAVVMLRCSWPWEKRRP